MDLDGDKIIEKYKNLLSEATHRLVLLESVIEEKDKEISKLKTKEDEEKEEINE